MATLACICTVGTAFASTVLVNTEAFMTIDDVDSTSDVAIKFGNNLIKSITYDRTATRFEFNDDIFIAGTISGTALESSGSLIVNGDTAFNKINYLWPASGAAASGNTLKVNPTNGQLSWSASEPQLHTLGTFGLPNCGTGTGYLGFHGPANCNTTESGVETTLTLEGNVRATGISCIQVTDASCTLRATLRKNRGPAQNGDLQCTITNQSSCGDTGTATYTNGNEISITLNDTTGSCTDAIAVLCSIFLEW